LQELKGRLHNTGGESKSNDEVEEDAPAFGMLESKEQ